MRRRTAAQGVGEGSPGNKCCKIQRKVPHRGMFVALGCVGFRSYVSILLNASKKICINSYSFIPKHKHIHHMPHCKRVVVQSLSHVQLFVAPRTVACQTPWSFTSWSLLKLMSIESMILSNHLIPLLLLPSIFPSVRVFFNKLALCIRWPKYWSFSFSNSPSASVLPKNIQVWSPLGWTGWISLQSKGLSWVFSNTTVQKHQFLSTQLCSQSNSHIHIWLLEKP